MSRILAIDPGPVQSAYVLWEGRVCEHGIIDNARMLDALWGYSFLEDTPRLAIETIQSYGMPVGAETFETCIWIGRFVQHWLNISGNLIHQIVMLPRKDIKLHLCGTTRAKDANIRQALLDRYGPQGKKANPGKLFGVKSHEWSALAVAVCAEDRIRTGHALTGAEERKAG